MSAMPDEKIWEGKLKIKVKVSDYKSPQTIKRDELERLQFCNSKKLPRKIRINGKTLEWVGIGWIEVTPDPDAVMVI